MTFDPTRCDCGAAIHSPADHGLREAESPLWRVAITEVNEAHAVLDRLGAPTVKRIVGRDAVTKQDVTVGLKERLQWLADTMREMQAATLAARPADTPTPLDDLFSELMDAEDESAGCRVAESRATYCCLWNKREPCEDCAELERQNRRTLQAAFDRGRVAPAPSGWQDIETAPKDGRDILVYTPEGRNDGDEWVAAIEATSWLDHEQYGRYGGWRGIRYPWRITHWQPLPAPPTSPTAPGQEP